MTFALTLVFFVVVLALCWRFLGAYMVAVFEGRSKWMAWLERPIYKVLGVDEKSEQSWKGYAVSVVIFSGIALLITYAIFRLQGHLPFNPQHFGAVRSDTAWNTSVSFVTNTNWQSYAGEVTMSDLSQMGSLAVQNFLSAAVGISVAIALVRGFARQGSKTIGNFWVDFVRSNVYVLLPISFFSAIIFMANGAAQTLGGAVNIHDALNGVSQQILRGPMASQEVIKQLGTNGGGFFNANGANPFENPTGLTNIMSALLILCIPVALTYVFGKMVGNLRQGVAVLAVMAIIFGAWLAIGAVAEHDGSFAMHAANISQTAANTPVGNMEGKESRFGVSSSVLYNIVSTQTSTGSVDSFSDSYTPIGGMMVLTGMQLGEISPGGVGTGLYGILLFAVIAVFIGGLMVGRTPEYLGKKIQAREMKYATFAVLVMPITVLVLTAIAAAISAGRAGPLNVGPHGFSEILYAYTSQTNNNGSAFAGISANTPFYNITGSLGLLAGRFPMIIATLALAGSLAAKKKTAVGLGTFRTDQPMFVVLLLGIILIVGGLSFFPALSLGPLVEQFSGRFFK